MKKTFFFILILVLYISCRKEKVKTETPKNEQVQQDSISFNDFGEHKGIHQQEWEEHQKEIDVDTLIVK